MIKLIITSIIVIIITYYLTKNFFTTTLKKPSTNTPTSSQNITTSSQNITTSSQNTTTNVFNGSSLSFDGLSNTFISSSNLLSDTFNFNNNPFTIDFWLFLNNNLNDNSKYIYSIGTSFNIYFTSSWDGTNNIYYLNLTINNNNYQIIIDYPISTWNYFYIYYSNTNIYIYQNGVLKTQLTITTLSPINLSNNYLQIGKNILMKIYNFRISYISSNISNDVANKYHSYAIADNNTLILLAAQSQTDILVNSGISDTTFTASGNVGWVVNDKPSQS
jgi:hypothetical protein